MDEDNDMTEDAWYKRMMEPEIKSMVELSLKRQREAIIWKSHKKERADIKRILWEQKCARHRDSLPCSGPLGLKFY